MRTLLPRSRLFTRRIMARSSQISRRPDLSERLSQSAARPARTELPSADVLEQNVTRAAEITKTGPLDPRMARQIGDSRLDDLPQEIIRLISGELPFEDLKEVRTVCKSIGSAATAELFRDIVLVAEEDSVERLNHIKGNGELWNSGRRATIYTHPDRNYNTFNEESEEVEGCLDLLSDSVPKLILAPAIDIVNLVFTQHSLGKESSEQSFTQVAEGIEFRQEVLKLVFGAMADRVRSKSLKPVRSLTIQNLQNYPLEAFTQTEDFKLALSGVTELHLEVAVEYNTHGPDHDAMMEELRTFYPHLRERWLEPIKDQLTSLSLYNMSEWGLLPGLFAPKGLIFPKLESLYLGNYTIGNDSQLDWVLEQKSLRKLALDSCAIACRFKIDNELYGLFNPDLKAVVEQWPDKKNFNNPATWARSARYNNTWAFFFDKIRTELPNLRHFAFEKREQEFSIFSREDLSVHMGEDRYNTFNSGVLPSHWLSPEEYDENDELEEEDEEFGADEDLTSQDDQISKSDKEMEGDRLAVNKLLETISSR